MSTINKLYSGRCYQSAVVNDKTPDNMHVCNMCASPTHGLQGLWPAENLVLPLTGSAMHDRAVGSETRAARGFPALRLDMPL